MNEPQVIKAVFYNWRPVVGHKRLQLIFEVPLEETAVVLKMLGAPMPDKETWCAIALLDKSVDAANTKERRAFCDLPMPAQAVIKSNDTIFQEWMNEKLEWALWDPEKNFTENCAQAIRNYCGVQSRTDILPETQAGKRWLELLREFEGYR